MSGKIGEPERSGDTRAVGGFALLALGVNGIVGVGIFFVPSDLARSAPGLGSVVVFAATAAALMPVAIVLALLGKRFPEDGGPVVFARAAFGEFASFVVGWVTYVSAIASAAAVMSGLTGAVAPAVGAGSPVAQRLFAAALVTSLAALVAAGIVLSARVWTTLTVLKLIPLLALVAVFLALNPAFPPAPEVRVSASWLGAGLTAMFALQGFEIVPVIAGQTRAPERVIPWATLGALAFAGILYVGLQAACVAALPALASSRAPVAEAAGVLGGPWLARLVTAGTSVSSLGICMGMMVTTPRYLSALAKDGRLGFRLDSFGARGVPLRALFVTWVLVSALVQSGTRGELFALSSVAVLAQYVVTAAALIVLALRRFRGLSPAQAWIGVPAIAVGLVLAGGASLREGVVAGIAIVLGLALKFLSRR